MKRRLLSLLLAFVMVLGMLPAVAMAEETAGEPAKVDGVFQIGTADELLWFANAVNGGQTDLKAVLTADIDLTGEKWPGIGTSSKRFSGSFDGQNHTVTFKDANCGLFSYVNGTQSNVVSIKNVITAGSIKRSAIAHTAKYVRFERCINRASIGTGNSESYLGGLVGDGSHTALADGKWHNVMTFIECGNEASVVGDKFVGGILGYGDTNVIVERCYNTGRIDGISDVGGLVGFMQGYNDSVVRYSYNTGIITGDSNVGGIVGYMKNGTKVQSSYNAGHTFNAITGGRFNHSASISNSFFLGVASSRTSPDYTETKLVGDANKEIRNRASAVTAAEMATEDFATRLGDAFKQSCPTPVLSWQTASGHEMEDGVCTKCRLNSTEKEIYDVTFQDHNGVSFTGEAVATQGGSYTFTLEITEGYAKNSAFAIKVDGTVINAASDGKYTVVPVKGPLSITVVGVDLQEGVHGIRLPDEGYGYRIEGEKSVEDGKDYTFKINFLDGFKPGLAFKVQAVEIQTDEEIESEASPHIIDLAENGGKYTITQVKDNYRIAISGVSAVPTVDPITVYFTISQGEDGFYVSPQTEEAMAMLSFQVPYFDLSLYGLERYYYNEFCYKDEKGNIRSTQQVGTPESAYNKITAMHAFIVATELYYLEMSPGNVGKGSDLPSFNKAVFDNAISWSQAAGSSFMDFWDYGTNLNYYLNYKYPLAYSGWGSTSDQILLKNGDSISAHFIMGNASGSNFGFFTVNDANGRYSVNMQNVASDYTDHIEVDAGEKFKLTYYWTVTTGNYGTNYRTMPNEQLYWVYAEEDGVPPIITGVWDEDLNDYIDPWHKENLGKNTMVTDGDGNITINTAGLKPGTYYISSMGGFTEGGGADNAGFVSRGNEVGPAIFKLTVNEYDAKLGDVNRDTQITSKDVSLIQQYIAKLTTDVNEGIADVNGDGVVTSKDINLIQQYIAKLIDSFPEK